MTNCIGRYEIEAELGHGGFGQVFRAFDPTVGRKVALKTLTAHGDPELLKRFRNEAAAAGRLRHINIVIIYDFGDHEGSPYLVMELLDGDDLEHLIESRSPLSLLQKLDIIAQSAAGLHHAHANGIVHRDVKPANIMVQRDGVVKIVDFGIALLSQATAARITLKGSLIGTVPYMAPEQFIGSPSDALTDIFAFGVTCYKLISGTHPFDAPEMAGLMANIMNKNPDQLRALSPECPEALERAVFKMLAKDRDSRYQNLEDLRFDLEPVILELRKERVGDLLAKVRELMASNQLDSAQAIVREALETEPSNRTARDLRESLQRQIWENDVRPRVTSLVNTGREQLHTRRFDAAIGNFESALQLDRTNSEIQSLLAHARAACDRANRATRLLEDAQHSLTRGDATAAHGIVLEALSTDPQNDQAEKLRASIEEHLRARERARRLDEGLNQARRLMVLEGFERAIDGLKALSKEYPESTAVQDLLARANAERDKQARRRQLQAAVEQAKTLLKRGAYQEAVERLTAWRADFPESEELRDLASLAAEELTAQKQAEAIDKAMSDARALAGGQRFDEALELLRGVVAEYPSANAIRELIQTIASVKNDDERKAALEQAAADAKSLIGQQRFEEAVARLGAFARAYGSATQIEPLRREAEEGQESQRRLMAVRKLMADARALVNDGRPESATRLLEAATAQFPEDSELTHLLSETRHIWEEQRQAEAISKIISEAESLNRAREFERALAILDRALSEYGGADRLVRCRQATLASQTRHERDQLRRIADARVRALRQEGKLDEAIAAVDAALRELGDETTLLELRQQIEREQVAQERAAEVRTIFDEAQTLLDRGHVLSATEMLYAATLRFPGEQMLATLKSNAETRLQEQRRAEEIARIAGEARAHAREQRFDAALGLLDASLRQHGSDGDLTALRDQVVAAKADQERQLALRELAGKVRLLLSAGSLAEARSAVDAGLLQFGQDPGLLELRALVEAEQKRLRRMDSARKLAKQAEDLMAAGRAGEGLDLLEKAGEFADQPDIAALKVRARQAVEQQRRAQAVQEIERLIRAQIAEGHYAEAREAIGRALQQYPHLGEIEQLRTVLEAASERAQALQQARQAQERGDLDQALALARKGLAAAPADREWQAIQKQIEAGREQRRRAAAIQNVSTRAAALLVSGQAEAARGLLQPAAAEYPGERELAELLRRAEDACRRAARERELAELRAQAEVQLSEHKYEQALAVLSRFPGEARFSDLVAQAQMQLEAQRRQDARSRAVTELLAIEQQMPATRKSKLVGLLTQAQKLQRPHPGDSEIAAILDSIERKVNEMRSAPPASSRLSPKWIGLGAGAVSLVALSFVVIPPLLRRAEPPKTPSSFPVEIRTDPPGAAVSVGDRHCTTPDCKFTLPPGQYNIEAQLQGYRPGQKTLTVNDTGSSGVANLVLEPEPPAPPPAGVEKGTLLVRTGESGARILVDNVPQGLTDARGEWRAVIEAGQHTVQAQKAGYQSPTAQSVTVADAKVRPVTFGLRPLPARLEIRGVPSGAEVRVAGATARLSGSVLSAVDIAPGDQTLQVTVGKSSRQVVRRFDPGITLTLAWRDIAPPVETAAPSAPPPAALPPVIVTAEAKEQQAWDRVRNSSDMDQIEAFLRENPSGAHADAARARLEDLAWGRVNQSDGRSVQVYLQRFPRGAHLADAQRAADDLNWNAVNKGDLQALQAFLDQNASSRHRPEAQSIVDRLNQERQAAAASAPAPTAAPQPSGSKQLAQAMELNKRGASLYSKSPQAAIALFNEAIVLAPKLVVAYVNRGSVYYSLGRFEQAAADFEKAVAIEPDHPTAKGMLADARRKLAAGVEVAGNGVSSPIPLKNIEPQYTPQAQAAHLQGTVFVELVVNTQGQPEDVKVVRKLGMGLDEKAVEAVQRMKFTPGMKNGRIVPVMITIEMKFKPTK